MENTYTFSTALRMMRYGGKKMMSVEFNCYGYYFVENNRIYHNKNGLVSYVSSFQNEEIMGSWVEVKE